jgi:flagellar motor switch protein FliG
MPNQVFTGIQRAAILLLSIGEHNAAEVLGFLPAEDIRRLSLQMASLPSIEKMDVDRVVDDFATA